MYRIVGLIAFLLTVATPSAHAGAILHIGNGYGMSCQTGGCPLYAGEVNNYDTNLDIYVNSSGAPALQDPVLLILGVPNTSAANQLSGNELSQARIIDDGTNTQTAITFNFGTNSFGLSGNGYGGLMTASTKGDVYSFLGLSGGNGSNSFTNWSQWDTAVNGITATNFGIYVFAFHPGTTAVTDFAGQDFLDVAISGIPEGTFAVGYGVDASGKDYSTPFTEAGLKDRPPRVPEPMTLSLMGIGLAGLGLSRRRKNG